MRTMATVGLAVLVLGGCEAKMTTFAELCQDDSLRGAVVVDGYLESGSRIECGGAECEMDLVAQPGYGDSVEALVRRGKYGSSVELFLEDGKVAYGALYRYVTVYTADAKPVDSDVKLRLEGKGFDDSGRCKMRISKIERAP
jgi:hypothetical protein